MLLAARYGQVFRVHVGMQMQLVVGQCERCGLGTQPKDASRLPGAANAEATL